jgi:uncharacterized protein
MQVLCILLLVIAPVMSWAASFNCQKAATRLDKMICGDPQLSRLDEEPASAYKYAKSLPGKNAEPAVVDQRRWFKSQRNACRDAACLTLRKSKGSTISYAFSHVGMPDEGDSAPQGPRVREHC